jgi:ethanolamine transporter EutH
MSSWSGFVLAVLVIFVAIAPRQVLGPLFGVVGRHVGVGVVALLSLCIGGYTLGGAASDHAHWIGLGELALGAVCAAWWAYRQFVPVYRDQAPASDLADER